MTNSAASPSPLTESFDTPKQVKRIVVGVDGSEGSQTALRWALREARLRGVNLHAVLAWKYHPHWSDPGPGVRVPASYTPDGPDLHDRVLHRSGDPRVPALLVIDSPWPKTLSTPSRSIASVVGSAVKMTPEASERIICFGHACRGRVGDNKFAVDDAQPAYVW